MKLKFLRATAVGRSYYTAGQVVDVKDQHAAEVYIAHGYAVAVDGAAPPAQTLKPGPVPGSAPAVQTAAAPAQPKK